MKTLILAVSLMTSVSAFAAEKTEAPNGIGPQPGDSCYCPTCLGHNRCSGTLYNEERSPGSSGRQTSNGNKKKATRVRSE